MSQAGTEILMHFYGNQSQPLQYNIYLSRRMLVEYPSIYNLVSKFFPYPEYVEQFAFLNLFH